MLEIQYGAELETLRTFTTVLSQIKIGSGPECTLQLEGDGIHREQCELYLLDDHWMLVPRATRVPMWVNGKVLEAPVRISTVDRIRIGPFTLQLKPIANEPVEQDLIAAARDDLAGRAVYADWLEERGQWDRAEFLRLTVAAAGQAPEDPDFAKTAIRIQSLARCLDQGWRLELSSSDVEGCKELRREFTCNMTWDRLAPTEDPTVRNCGACRSNVYYCRSEPEASRYASEGRCIVLDLGVDRSQVRRSVGRAPYEMPAGAIPPGMYMPAFTAPPPHPNPAAAAVARPCPMCASVVQVGHLFCSQCGTPC